METSGIVAAECHVTGARMALALQRIMDVEYPDLSMTTTRPERAGYYRVRALANLPEQVDGVQRFMDGAWTALIACWH